MKSRSIADPGSGRRSDQIACLVDDKDEIASKKGTKMQKLKRILSCSAGLMVLSAGIGHAETGSSEGRVGIIGITRGSADLRVPPSQPEDRTWRYGLGFALQIAPTEAGLFCNIRREYGPGVDFEIGTNVILFDDLSDINAKRAVVVSRNHEEPNPNSKPPGKPSIMVKYPVQPGFVPFGALGKDGSPHPHAGTGFGVASALSWPAAVGDQLRGDVWWSTDPRGVKPFRGEENHSYFEVQQYLYDGNTFKVIETRKVADTDLLSGWQVRNRGLGPAIPDGEDLIMGMVAGRSSTAGNFDERRLEGESVSGSVLVRWRRQNGRWSAIDITPVSAVDGSFEPSVVRDRDGSLLFCVRGGREPDYNDVRIWRFRDDGRSWEKIIHVRGIVGSTPICLNQATDGSLYVASNMYQVLLHPRPHTYTLPRDRHGNPRGGGWLREILALWPLNQDRKGLQTPIIARDCRSEFGFPPGGSNWNADHPVATNLRLRDGRWHNTLVMRVLEYGEIVRQLGPAPQSGTYVEEVHAAGKPVPGWRFED